MNIARNAFSGPLMSSFNGKPIAVAISDKGTETVGVSGNTKLYCLVDEKTNAARQTLGLFLTPEQVTS